MNAAQHELSFGVYIHFPWCRKKCPYCDFAVEVALVPPHAEYASLIAAELQHRSSAFAQRELVSIYFGGGTPSLWQTDMLANTIALVRRRFEASDKLEITLEVNPIDCSADNFAAWASAGINRLSIGVQSTNAADLAMLGRDHRFGDGLAAVAAAVHCGWFRVSADLILGTPSRDAPATIADLASPLLDCGVDHLSVYELTIEERTPFGARSRSGRLRMFDDQVLAQLYTDAHDYLTAAGFVHYEISSYAKPGKLAVHNSLYWRCAPFLGLGVGAASLELAADGAGCRVTNPRTSELYRGVVNNVATATTLTSSNTTEQLWRQSPGVTAVHSTAQDLAAERIWLGLRTLVGVPRSAFDHHNAVLARLESFGLVTSSDERVVPTLRGYLFSDTIAKWVVEAFD